MNYVRDRYCLRILRMQIRAVKPDWEFGASAALSLPKKSSTPVWSLSADDTLDEDIPIIKPVGGATWKLDADDDDLIEDDALLEKEDLAKPDKGRAVE